MKLTRKHGKPGVFLTILWFCSARICCNRSDLTVISLQRRATSLLCAKAMQALLPKCALLLLLLGLLNAQLSKAS
jgi:hypothetical protein